MPRAAGIHPAGCTEHQRRPARPFAFRLDLFHSARADQDVEMEANGVGMDVEQLGDRDDAHRSVRSPQYPQDVEPASEGMLGRLDDSAHFPRHSVIPAGYLPGPCRRRAAPNTARCWSRRIVRTYFTQVVLRNKGTVEKFLTLCAGTTYHYALLAKVIVNQPLPTRSGRCGRRRWHLVRRSRQRSAATPL